MQNKFQLQDELRTSLSDFKSKTFIKIFNEDERRLEICIGTGYITETQPGVNHLLEHMIAVYMRKTVKVELINAATAGFDTEYYFRADLEQANNIIDKFFDIQFSQIQQIDFSKQMQRIDSEFYFRQGLDDFFIGLKSAAFGGTAPSACGKLQYFNLDVDKWMAFCHDIYQTYYTPYNTSIKYYGMSEEEEKFEQICNKNMLLNNNKIMEIYSKQISGIVNERKILTDMVFPKHSHNGSMVAFQSMFMYEQYCVSFIKVTDENIHRLQQLFILLDYLITMPEIIKACDNVDYYYFIENKVHGPFMQFVISFTSKKKHAAEQIECFIRNFQWFYEDVFPHAILLNADIDIMRASRTIQPLRRDIGSICGWVKLSQPIFSSEDGKSIMQLFENRLYLVHGKKEIIKFDDKIVESQLSELQEAQKCIDGFNRFMLNRVMTFSKLRTKDIHFPISKKDITYYTLILVPGNDEELFDSHLDIAMKHIEKLKSIVDFDMDMDVHLQYCFNIAAREDDLMLLVSSVFTLMNSLFNGNVCFHDGTLTRKDTYSQIFDNYTMLSFKAQTKQTFQYCIVPTRMMAFGWHGVLNSKKTLTVDEKKIMVKIYQQCKMTDTKGQQIFDISANRNEVQIKCINPLSILDQMSIDGVCHKTKFDITLAYGFKISNQLLLICDGQKKLQSSCDIYELYDSKLNNKMKILWFIDSEQTDFRIDYINFFAYKARQYNAKLFFGQYYYMDIDVIHGVQPICVFELGLNDMSNKQKAVDDFSKIINYGLKDIVGEKMLSYITDMLQYLVFIFPRQMQGDNADTLQLFLQGLLKKPVQPKK